LELIYENLEKLEELFNKKRDEILKSVDAVTPDLEEPALREWRETDWASYLNKIGCEVVEGRTV
jgi:hypothetical protein